MWVHLGVWHRMTVMAVVTRRVTGHVTPRLSTNMSQGPGLARALEVAYVALGDTLRAARAVHNWPEGRENVWWYDLIMLMISAPIVFHQWASSCCTVRYITLASIVKQTRGGWGESGQECSCMCVSVDVSICQAPGATLRPRSQAPGWGWPKAPAPGPGPARVSQTRLRSSDWGRGWWAGQAAPGATHFQHWK